MHLCFVFRFLFLICFSSNAKFGLSKPLNTMYFCQPRQFLEMDDLNIVFNCKTRKNDSLSVIILLGKSKTRSGGFKCIRKKDVEELEQNEGKKRLTVHWKAALLDL